MTYQQARIIHIALQCCAIFVHLQSDVRFCGVVANVDNSCVFQPKECIVPIAILCTRLQGRKSELLFVLRELRGYLVEDRHHLVGHLSCIIEYVVTIDGQNVALRYIYGIEIFRFNILLNGLWHTSHYHIKAESIHSLTMESLPHRFLFCKHLPYQVHQHIITCSPKKLFKVHWVHLYRTLFRWKYDTLSVFLDAHQRPRLNVVVSTICYQKLNGSSRPRTQLNLVKNNERLAFMEPYLVVLTQI